MHTVLQGKSVERSESFCHDVTTPETGSGMTVWPLARNKRDDVHRPTWVTSYEDDMLPFLLRSIIFL
jgi:hypothetical protein